MKNAFKNWMMTLAAGIALAASAPSVSAINHTILPQPKSITMGTGAMPLTAQSRIVFLDPALEIHASALQEDIWRLTNMKLAKVNAGPKAGDIVLKINPLVRADEDIYAPKNMELVKTRDMAHTINVAEMAVVEGWDFRAVCEGTASIMSGMIEQAGKFSIPHMKVKDWPHADFNGTMVDCGRQWISTDTLKMMVDCCRFNKVRQLIVHVGDDQGYSMPSKAFPKLGMNNGSCCEGVPPKVWTWEEMVELEAYAVARGIAIVPELETPGHHQAMGRNYRSLFDGPGCMDMASEELYRGLDTVIAEMCSIFKSSQYFSIGCDEANNGTGAGPWAEVYKRRHAIPTDAQSVRNGHEIYVVHMKRMADILRKYGKLTIAYENFPDDARLNKDIIPIIWYPHAVAHEYQKRGWTTISMPWNEEPNWNMYLCNGSVLKRTDRVLGAASPMWQMSAICVTQGWAQNTIARSERTWGPDNDKSFPEYAAIKDKNRQRLDRIAVPVKMQMDGVDGGAVVRAQNFLTGRMVFGGKLKVTLSVANPQGGKIHYTLDDSEPTTSSPVYTQPLMFEKTFMLNSALFVDGRQVGGISRAKYDWINIEGWMSDWSLSGPYKVEGKIGKDLFDVEFAPEKNEPAKWIPFKKPQPPDVVWNVNFGTYPGFGEHMVGYFRCQIYSPKAQPAHLFTTTNDGEKTFFNGKLIHSANAKRNLSEGEKTDIQLNEGWNQLLIKQVNWTGGWTAKARILSPTGKRMDDIKFKAE